MKKSLIALLGFVLMLGLVQAGTYGVNYNFVNQNNIQAFSCRNGPFPQAFPSEINAQACNREFIDITSNSNLDLVEGIAYGGLSWTNYANHHFFVLSNVNKNTLKGFNVAYVTKNKYQFSPPQNHYLYVRNFNTGQWDILANASAAYLQQGFLNFNSSIGYYGQYVNNSKMWFMGTEGALNGKAVASDSFTVKLFFDCALPGEVNSTSNVACPVVK